MNPILVCDHVGKRYRRYRSSGIRDAIAAGVARIFSSRTVQEEESRWLWALKDLSFELTKGKTLGIIGANGAGKTTTLKLLSRVALPTRGSIQSTGKISALIELGAGFHPELTGRENVYLNGTILGMRRNEITSRLQEIIDFSGISAFIDTPVKYYSSGMYARLGFSVAAYTDPDILLVDEVLAVGDYSFQQQCYQRMQELKRGGTTIVLVSHNLSAISETCDEVVVLNHGEKIFQGPTGLGLAEYASAIRGNIIQKESLAAGVDGIGRRLMTHEARIRDVRVTDTSGTPVQIVKPGECVTVQAIIDTNVEAVDPHFSCFVRDELGRLIYDQTTLWQNYHTPVIHKGQSAKIIINLQLNLVEGIYQIGIDMHYSDLSCYYDRIESAATVVVRGGDGAKGIADLRCQFNIDTPQSPNATNWQDE